jgi:uncharacterized membrane protein YcgQ (UPF0703/DUF1980 family)
MLSSCQRQIPADEGEVPISTAAAPSAAPFAVTQSENAAFDPASDPAEIEQPSETFARDIGGDVVEIKEKLFIAQINDVYLNPEDYFGKTIKYEGMFTQYAWEENNMTYYLVYRQSPGCCGADGQAGFEVIWAEGSEQPYPSENDWCEVVGTLESYEELGEMYLHIVLDSLTVKSERGLEFVEQ